MALLPIFCVARSSRTDLSMLVARALKIGKIADGVMPPTYETMHYSAASWSGARQMRARAISQKLGGLQGRVCEHSRDGLAKD